MVKNRVLYRIVTLIWLVTLIAQPVSALSVRSVNAPELDTTPADIYSASSEFNQSGGNEPAMPAPPDAPQPIQMAQIAQTYSDLSPDFDGDGIPNDVEIAGWENGRGTFTTDPETYDSDGDGLSDGEEQFYNTDPNDDAMPGLYIIYDDALKTRQYWLWVQYGNKYITYGRNNPASKPDIVVRRGATFEVGGPAGDLSVFNKLEPHDLTKFTVSERNPCTGRWTVTVADDAELGWYSLYLDNALPSDPEFNMHVIFELPDDMSDDEIATFLYDDDPDDPRDDTSLTIDTRQYCDETADPTTVDPERNQSCSESPLNYWAYAYAYRFDNQQYERWFFRNQVSNVLDDPNDYIGSISDITTPWQAATVLRQAVDDKTAFDHPFPKYDSWAALDGEEQQCSNIAALLSAFSRSAGVPSRPIMTDWRNSTFDHATEFWVDGGSGSDWHVARGYSDSGPPQVRSTWSYAPWYSPGTGGSDMVYVSGANWEWDETSDGNSGNMGNLPYWDAIFNAKNSPPHEIRRKVWWETVTTAYWNNSWLTGWGWGNPPTEPVITPTARIAAQADTWHPPIARQNADATAFLGKTTGDYGVDLNANGRFDRLVLETTVEVKEAGTYWIYALLGATKDSPQMVGTGGEAAAAAVELTLEPGTHIVQIPFFGRGIFDRRADGPYTLMNLWLTDFESVDRGEIMSRAMDSLDDAAYLTNAYSYQDFEAPAAELSGEYIALDTSGNPAYQDSLLLNIGLNIYTPDAYTVKGELYGKRDNLVGAASWTGAAGPATLQFDRLSGGDAPYTLKFVELTDSAGEALGSVYEAYTAEAIAGNTRVASEEAIHVYNMERGIGITPTQVYTDSVVDLDGDGRYDYLNIDVQLEVSQAGAYRLEGWLMDRYDKLVAFDVTDPLTISSGIQTLSLQYDGGQLYGAGNYSYTLVALKILEGYTYTVRDEVEVAMSTDVYTRAEFEPPTVARIAFEDDMENGDAKWMLESTWAITPEASFSPEHAWSDSPGGDYANNADISITFANSLDFSDVNDPALSFKGCYALDSGDSARVEVSTDGSIWTAVETYTSASTWDAELVDLSAYSGAASVDVRFRLSSNSSGTDAGWHVDDVMVVGNPYPAEAFFDYSPQPPVTDDPITFMAAYTPTDALSPITYTINYGDGTSIVDSDIPTSAHTYNDPGYYTVVITVSNPYGQAVYSYTFYVGQEITGISFVNNPVEPALTEQTYFTATVAPANATLPITYTWNFSGAIVGPSTSHTALYTFIDHTGPHPVGVTSTNRYGSQSAWEFVGVGCTALTGISYTYQPTAPNVGDVVTFTAVHTPSGQPITRTWDFGDGSPLYETTGMTATHTFTAGNDFMVSLTGDTGDCGFRTVEELVTIHQEVTGAAFTFLPPPPWVTGQTITFTGNYTPDIAYQPITYTWNFGDGSDPVMTGDDPTIPYSFSEPGTYTVWMTATNADGYAVYSYTFTIAQALESVYFTHSPDPPDLSGVVAFTAHSAPADATQPITYTWDLGDGTPAIITTSRTITHTFSGGSYMIQLDASNGFGSANFHGDIIIPVALDNAFFTYTPPVTYGVVAVLQAHYSPVTATAPIVYEWVFGDGLTATVTNVPTVSHRFRDVGDLLVQLTVSNGYGSDTYSETLSVNGNPVTSAFFDVDPDPAIAYEPVTFIGYGGPQEATTPFTYTWNYGDGSAIAVSGNPIISHTYTAPGPYTVWITVTNGYGTEVYSYTVNVLSHQPDWEKQIWVNNEGPYNPDHVFTDLQAGDLITITDRVTQAYSTNPISFTVRDEWGDWLNLTSGNASSGTVHLPPPTHVLTWEVASALPSVVYAFTKTFEVADDNWETGRLTETLSADTAKPPVEPITLQFYHAGVYTPVTGVALTVSTAAPIYTDTVVQFSADILPDEAEKPYTYTLDFGSGLGEPLNSSDDSLTFAYTFTATGTHNVEIAVWNIAMTQSEAVTDSVSVTVSEQSSHDSNPTIYLPIVLKQ